MKVLLATTNPAKVKHYGIKLKELGIEVLTINDLESSIEVVENGSSPLENAIIKAEAYYKLTGFPTIAIDDGLYFIDVPEDIQPGPHVRRVNNKVLSDEEMLSYYSSLVNKYGTEGKLRGFFFKSVAILIKGKLHTYTYKKPKLFINEVSSTKVLEYPLDSLCFEEHFNKYTSELNEEEIKELENLYQDGIREFIQETVMRELDLDYDNRAK